VRWERGSERKEERGERERNGVVVGERGRKEKIHREIEVEREGS